MLFPETWPPVRGRRPFARVHGLGIMSIRCEPFSRRWTHAHGRDVALMALGTPDGARAPERRLVRPQRHRRAPRRRDRAACRSAYPVVKPNYAAGISDCTPGRMDGCLHARFRYS